VILGTPLCFATLFLVNTYGFCSPEDGGGCSAAATAAGASLNGFTIDNVSLSRQAGPAFASRNPMAALVASSAIRAEMALPAGYGWERTPTSLNPLPLNPYLYKGHWQTTWATNEYHPKYGGEVQGPNGQAAKCGLTVEQSCAQAVLVVKSLQAP
jgi:hypothetical protein